jgi:hypothetical protein
LGFIRLLEPLAQTVLISLIGMGWKVPDATTSSNRGGVVPEAQQKVGRNCGFFQKLLNGPQKKRVAF